MSGRLSIALLVALAVVAALLQGSAAKTTHVVGDGMGWTIPPAGSVAYTTWAASQTFVVGDILVFNFTSGLHDVVQVAKAEFEACNTSNPIFASTTSPTNVTLDAAGEYHFICTFGAHCSLGQKLAINVTAATSPAPQPSSPAPHHSHTPSPAPLPASPAPQHSQVPSPAPLHASPSPHPTTPSPSPISSPTPAPSRSPVTYTVGDSLGWIVPPAGAYRNWTSNKTFMVGDILVFNFLNGTHDVAEVTGESYGSCNTSSTLSLFTNPPVRITLTKAGVHFFICTLPRHCSLGQQLAINVTGSPTATSPSPTASPPSTSTTPSSQSPTGTGAATPPTPGNSATSLQGVAGLSATFLALAVALLY